MAKLLMKVKGFDGEVELMTDRIVITRPATVCTDVTRSRVAASAAP